MGVRYKLPPEIKNDWRVDWERYAKIMGSLTAE